MIYIALLYFILALTFVFAKNAVFVCSPIFFIAVRMMLAGTLLLAPTLTDLKKWLPISKKDFSLLCIVTLLHIYIPFVGEFWSLQYIDALKVNFLFALTPFFAIVIDSCLKSRMPRLSTITGILLGFMALVGVIKTNHDLTTLPFSIISLSFAELVLMGVILSSTVAWFFIKQLLDRNFHITTINGISMFFGGILSLITALTFETITIIDIRHFFLYLFLLIFFSNVLFYNLYGTLLKRYSITLLTSAGFLTPLFGLIIDSLIRLQLPNPLYCFALAAITMGLIFIARGEEK